MREVRSPLFKPTATAHSVTCKSLSRLAPTRSIALCQSNSIPVKSDKCKDSLASDAQTDSCVHSSSIPKQMVAAANFYKHKLAIAANRPRSRSHYFSAADSAKNPVSGSHP